LSDGGKKVFRGRSREGLLHKWGKGRTTIGRGGREKVPFRRIKIHGGTHIRVWRGRPWWGEEKIVLTRRKRGGRKKLVKRRKRGTEDLFCQHGCTPTEKRKFAGRKGRKWPQTSEGGGEKFSARSYENQVCPLARPLEGGKKGLYRKEGTHALQGGNFFPELRGNVFSQSAITSNRKRGRPLPSAPKKIKASRMRKKKEKEGQPFAIG